MKKFRTTRREMTLGVALAAATLAFAIPASAQDYPSQPIRLVVPHGAGGGTDVYSRQLAVPVAEQLDTSIAVVNVTGGGTAIGAQEVARSKPDGYTLLSTHVALLTSSAMGANTMGPESLVPVAQTAEETQVIAVKADSPMTSLKDFMDAVAPGGDRPKLGISAGAGNHFAFLQMLMGLDENDANFVPVGGGGPSMTALLGGTIDVGTFTVSEVTEQVKSGDVRVLSVFGPERHPALPDVMTAKEEGFDIEIGLHYVWYAPKGTPADRIEILADAVETVVSDDGFQQNLRDKAIEPRFLRGDALIKTLADRYEVIKTIAASIQ